MQVQPIHEQNLDSSRAMFGNVNYVPPNARLFSNHRLLSIKPSLRLFAVNGAVIKMINQGRSSMRHVSRTQRVDPDWLFDRINLDLAIKIKNVDTSQQQADILTKKDIHKRQTA